MEECEQTSNTQEKELENEILKKFGFIALLGESRIENAGLGVYLSGSVEEMTIICIYPGLFYKPGEPIFFPSLRNDYLLRCNSGGTIDGKPHGLSRYMYKSALSKYHDSSENKKKKIFIFY